MRKYFNPTQCSSTLQSSFLRLQRAFTPTLNDKQNEKSQRTTLCISNSGLSATLKRKTINPRSVLSDSLVV